MEVAHLERDAGKQPRNERSAVRNHGREGEAVLSERGIRLLICEGCFRRDFFAVYVLVPVRVPYREYP